MNNGIEGDVQSRMDAFRGNPQALAQRYAQDQQLIDLLALQKLKSEKDAAARQMQMQAGQGQMPTIAQQREQELMGMAKQEVAQRVGAVGQQQAQQQQKNLQQAMQGGIAQAPAPNMMPAQAMASGGIVAFAEGGDTAFTRGLKSAFSISPPSEEEAARRKRREALAEIESEYESGPLQGALTLPSGEYDRRTAVRDYIRKNRSELISNPQMFSAFKANPETFISGGMRTAVGRITPAEAAPAPAAPAQAAPTPPQAAPAQVPPGAPPAQAAPAQVPPAQTAPAQGIAQAARQPAQAARQPAQPNEMQALQGALNKGFMGDIQASPEARATAAEDAYRKRFDPLYQQQQELAQQGIAQLQQRMAQQPKKDPLTEFLRGMSSQRTLGMALGAGGAGMSAAQREAFEQQAALEDQLQKLRETGLGAQVTQETARSGAGKEAAKTAAEARKAAMQSGATYAVGVKNAENRAEIAERDAIIREQNRALGLDEKTSNMIRQRLAAEEKIIDAKYAKDPRAARATFDADIAAQLKKERDTEYQNRKREIYAEFKKTPPEDIGAPAPAAAPAAANRPPLTSFKR
ncbi:MAG: hypothetical protein EHM17_16540 [Verrucomicrobiaceae bacterium]|nr:MAG: hypothetical protein EHM17_16540 [Verrucomicrobiaceae bacterium]